jgi:hypothetical protein
VVSKIVHLIEGETDFITTVLLQWVEVRVQTTKVTKPAIRIIDNDRFLSETDRDWLNHTVQVKNCNIYLVKNIEAVITLKALAVATRPQSVT